MNKSPSFALLITASLITSASECAWSDDATRYRSAASRAQTPMPVTGPGPGWYPPPTNWGRWYAQPRQQPPIWPVPPQGYGQISPRYPAREPFRAVPATPSAAENRLSAELEQTQEQLTEKIAELDDARATLEQLRIKLKYSLEAELALNEKVMTLTREQQALQVRVTELTTELRTTTATLEQNRQQIANNQKQTRALTAERDQLRDKLASQDEQLATLENELRAATEALQQAKSKTTASAEALSEAKAQAETLKNELTELKAQLERQQTTLLNARQTLIEEGDRLRSDLASRDVQLATLKSELQTAKEALQQAKSDTATSAKALSEARAQTETLNSELTALKAQMESQQTTLLDARQTLIEERDRLHDDLTGRDEQLAALKNELQTFTEALHQANSETATSAETLSAARAQAETLNNELAGLRAQLENRSTTLLETAQTLANVIAERDGLQAELVARDRELTEAQAALTSVQSEVDTLRQARLAATEVVEATLSEEADTDVSAVGEGSEEGAVEIAALQTAEPDTDEDGVPDSVDLCPVTQPGIAVESTGCAAGIAINLEGVNFRDDSHELTDEARRILDRVANILSRHTDLRLQVAGHTDALGDPARNQWLSMQRAQAVRDYLVTQGVNPRHIGAVGYGGQRPIADNTTEEGLRLNRRVELRRLQ